MRVEQWPHELHKDKLIILYINIDGINKRLTQQNHPLQQGQQLHVQQRHRNVLLRNGHRQEKTQLLGFACILELHLQVYDQHGQDIN